MTSLGAIVLAAGGSTRMGRPKQLAHFRGETLLRRAVRAAVEAGCLPVIVVTGAEVAQVAAEIEHPQVRLVRNEHWQDGIGTSIGAGVAALQAGWPDASGLVMLVCDQPFVDEEVIRSLVDVHTETGRSMIASRYAETLGIPALFESRWFSALSALDPREGAKRIIQEHLAEVATFDFPEGEWDIDTESDLERLLHSSGDGRPIDKKKCAIGDRSHVAGGLNIIQWRTKESGGR